MIRKVAIASLPVALLVVLAAAQSPATKPTAKPATKGFPAVALIFKAKCVACHSGKTAAGGYDLSAYAKVTGPSKHGKMVVAGKPDQSPLLAYLKGTRKPQMPMGGKPLSAAELKTISDWIAKGAKNK